MKYIILFLALVVLIFVAINFIPIVAFFIKGLIALVILILVVGGFWLGTHFNKKQE